MSDPAHNSPPPFDVAPGGSGSIPLTSLPRQPRARRATSLAARGEPMVWLTGGCVAVSVLMIAMLLLFVIIQGFATFWPNPLIQSTLANGVVVLGEPTRSDTFYVSRPLEDGTFERIPGTRTLFKTGNFDLTGNDFVWVNDAAVTGEARPEWAMIVERVAWGNAYGTLEGIIVSGETITDPAAAWRKFNEIHPRMRALFERARGIEREQMGAVASQQERLRLQLRSIGNRFGRESPEYAAERERQVPLIADLDAQLLAYRQQVNEINAQLATAKLLIRTPEGQIVPRDRGALEDPLQVWQVVRTYPANRLTTADKFGVYLSRWWEYLTGQPREANQEGGVAPAIIGTVLLTFIMILFVVPVGVIAAIYLREYAKQGLVTSIVRISVNNLAGVPSIVYGVFGLGFFVYTVGGFIDRGSSAPLATDSWVWLLVVTLLLTVGAIGTTFVTARLSRGMGNRKLLEGVLGAVSVALALGAVIGLLVAVGLVPRSVFGGFFADRLPDPTWGKSALIWASLTLALLTLPVVIVATEEALAAVPRSMREGAYACGASKWQTIRRIVLPRAMPGVMTGMILAIARGAGEVAPLMLVGAVKLAPDALVSLSWLGGAVPVPTAVHLDRSFMHLGFHIYDLGFQSRNSEAARSMVYTTTLLLIGIVVLLNVSAIYIRSRLRRAYATGQF